MSVEDILTALRRTGGEPERVEAKLAAGGLPRSCRETLSAFANTDGGSLLLGIDEGGGFTVVGLDDPVKIRDGIVQMSRDDMTPPLQISTEIVEIEGHQVVVAHVPPATADQRPVYVTSQGIVTGSYLRTGDGDRRISEAELALLVSSRGQPTYDAEAVEGTGVADLDEDAMRRTLQRVRRSLPRLAHVDDATALCRLGITTTAEPDAPLTLAGLLTFGEYPQRWFPQLMVSVVVHPAETDSRVRFIDNVSARGSIPEMVETALAVLQRHLSVRAVMGDFGRSDESEYPLEAVREAIVNAVMHRDYSPVTRGTQVQVDLFPDRLQVRSPGGLYGGVVVDDLGEEGVSSSRNAVLASLLAEAYMPMSSELVAENRSSGIPTMLGLARQRGLPRPVFTSTVTSFVVTMNRSELLGPEVRAWIAGLRAHLPTPAHELGLAMMRDGYITNAMLRQWGIDRVAAGQVLRDLVDQGLAVKEGGRRYARYVLDPVATGGEPPADLFTSLVPTVAEALQEMGVATAPDLATRTGLSRNTVLNHLKPLILDGRVTAEGALRSPRRRYRWAGTEMRNPR